MDSPDGRGSHRCERAKPLLEPRHLNVNVTEGSFVFCEPDGGGIQYARDSAESFA